MAQIGQETSVSAEDAGPRGIQQSPIHESPIHGPPTLYEFRQGVRTPGKRAPTAWLDQDHSGDYIPEPMNARKPRAKRAKRNQINCSVESGAECSPRTTKTANRERRPDKQPLMSNVTGSKHGLALNGESNSSYDESSRYPCRNHRGGAHQHQDEASASFSEIAPDHPATGGCKCCLAYGLHCPLLEAGSRYPCEFCVVDGEECELIMEPSLKQTCLKCKKKGIPCSFKVEPDRRGPCDSCIAASTDCVAGPLSQRFMAKSHMNRSRAEFPRKIPQQKSQVVPRSRAKPERRMEIQPGSLVSENYGHDNYIPQAMKFSSSKDHNQVISYKGVPRSAPTGVVRSIVTRFAHPISFNYEPSSPLELISCHWCNDILYGLVGLEPVEVEVIDYQNGGGYMEIENGHSCAGYLPSRMCTTCTLDRLTIAACTSHEVEPIRGINPDAFTVASYRHYLLPGITESAPFDWCYICPTPASYRCAKPQAHGMPSCGPNTGCGLLLCKRCACCLMGQYSGVLGRLIDGFKLHPGESVLRADAEFLHPKGELLQRFTHAGGMA